MNYDDSLYYTFIFSSLTACYQFRTQIVSVVYDYVFKTPGIGEVYSKKSIYTKRKAVYVKTEEGPMKIRYHKLPSIDTDIFLFKDYEKVESNKIVTNEEFGKLYGDNLSDDSFHITRNGIGIITDIVNPQDFRGDKTISGFMYNIHEDYIYLFKWDEKFVDFDKIIDNYEDRLDELIPDSDSSIDSSIESIVQSVELSDALDLSGRDDFGSIDEETNSEMCEALNLRTSETCQKIQS